MKLKKVIGPPGSGKTTYILDLVARAAKRYGPERVGALSYTKAAVEEMRERIFRETGARKEDAEHVRTIHSMCFKLLNLRSDHVADENISAWNEAHPELRLPLKVEPEETDEHYEKGRATDPSQANRLAFNRMQLYRNLMIPEEKWSDPEAETFFKAWNRWMFMEDMVDYTAMIEKAFEQEICPDVDVLFVDECQDLTPLQMALLKRWAERMDEAVFVGDGDQAIFRFAGSVPDVFIQMDHQGSTLLDRSYRIPGKVKDYAMRLIRQVSERDDVDYSPTGDPGLVIMEITVPDLSLPGSHMIITRCNFHLQRWKQFLMEEGEPWYNPYRPDDRSINPVETKLWRAVRTYLRVVEGGSINVGELRSMIMEMKSSGNLVKGVKTYLDDYTDMIDPSEKIDLFVISSLGIFSESFLSFRKELRDVFNLKGVSGKLLEMVKDRNFITSDPRITLGTIHSVKGGEADHVWVDLRTSPRCLRAVKASRTFFDDEVRIAYVASTRARKTLGLLSPRGAPVNPAFL